MNDQMSYMSMGSIKMWTQHACEIFDHLFDRKFNNSNIIHPTIRIIYGWAYQKGDIFITNRFFF